jgi:glyoxylase-like metal-dependent hydrolase (beta-lactamase superfamily II)
MSAPPATDHRLIDLLHLGRPHVIGAWRTGNVVVDPGPSSCLERLLPELERDPPRVLALTHIHLDHAGATGSLLRRFPGLEVWVHERGARHMIDPSRLLESARRLYGSEMQRLWGDVLPVPAERVRVLRGGEALDGFRVAYTPGHAAHHVCYLHDQSGWAFTGDLTGVRIDTGPVVVPTPPPDIDLVAWRESLGVVERWAPSGLAIGHFGSCGDVDEHLAATRDALERSEARALGLDEQFFAREMRADVARSGDVAAAYEQAVPPDQSFQGLQRYLRQRKPQRGGADAATR